MERRKVGFLFLGALLAAVVPAVAQSGRGAPAAQSGYPSGKLVNDLDYVFQERFRSTEGNIFGISRIPVTPEHRPVVHWKPDQEMEKRVARQLAEEGLTGVFLLAKRDIGPWWRGLDSAAPNEALKQRLAQVPAGRHGISRPILLSPGEAPKPLPTHGELVKEIQSSQAAFEKSDQRQFSVREWRIVARPVRATAECLDCHRKGREEKLPVGSVLGVAMYAFTPAAAPTAAP